MGHGGKFGEGPGTDPLGRRIAGHQFRVPLFQRHQFVEQGIVFGIGDLGIVQDVVAVIVVVNQPTEFFKPFHADAL